jgi:hypothetical protein
MTAYLAFGALTREIGTQIKALIQKGSFGTEFRRNVISDLRRPFSFDAFRHDRRNNVSGLKAGAYAGLRSKAAPQPP